MKCLALSSIVFLLSATSFAMGRSPTTSYSKTVHKDRAVYQKLTSNYFSQISQFTDWKDRLIVERRGEDDVIEKGAYVDEDFPGKNSDNPGKSSAVVNNIDGSFELILTQQTPKFGGFYGQIETMDTKEARYSIEILEGNWSDYHKSGTKVSFRLSEESLSRYTRIKLRDTSWEFVDTEYENEFKSFTCALKHKEYSWDDHMNIAPRGYIVLEGDRLTVQLPPYRVWGDNVARVPPKRRQH